MIIQLKGVTFNGDVIFGKSVVISDSTQALFSDKAYTRSITEAQKMAVQLAIESLVQEGLWDKIDVLYLPILAGKVDEAFINVKKTYGQKTVIKDRFTDNIEQTLSISENGGINLAENTTSNYEGLISYETIPGSFHYGYAYAPNLQICGFNHAQTMLGFKTNTGARGFLSLMQVFSADAKVMVYDGGFTSLKYENVPVLVGFNESGTVNSLINKNDYREYDYIDNSTYGEYGFDYTNSMTVFPLASHMGTMKQLNGVRFFTMGEHLTQSEMEKYSQIINELLTAF